MKNFQKNKQNKNQTNKKPIPEPWVDEGIPKKKLSLRKDG